jgi:hypothetical protein
MRRECSSPKLPFAHKRHTYHASGLPQLTLLVSICEALLRIRRYLSTLYEGHGRNLEQRPAV